MSIYPSLEDLKVDQLYQAQLRYEPPQPSAPLGTAEPSYYPQTHMYDIGQEAVQNGIYKYPSLNDYMGLELSEEVIAQNLPEYALVRPTQGDLATQSVNNGLVAPLSCQSLGLQKAQVSHAIRELTLCKDAQGRIGIRVASINNGIFVCLVMKGSPAALAGLRFGDQILQINGIVVAGFTMEKVHDLLRKNPANGISIVVRDRPFERTVTLHKDSVGQIGFHFKNGKIIGLVKESSAARNGLLTEHHLLEIDGQNVVGMKDKEITSLIENTSQVVTVTIIPSFVYDHIIKRMAGNLVKTAMDHSVPVI